MLKSPITKLPLINSSLNAPISLTYTDAKCKIQVLDQLDVYHILESQDFICE